MVKTKVWQISAALKTENTFFTSRQQEMGLYKEAETRNPPSSGRRWWLAEEVSATRIRRRLSNTF